MRLGRPGSITVDQLREQARQLGFEQADVTVLAGRAYPEARRAVWPLAETPSWAWASATSASTWRPSGTTAYKRARILQNYLDNGG